jgi:hypothetical protein
LAKMSENVGDYSIYSAKSTKAFDLLSDLLWKMRLFFQKIEKKFS